MKYLIDEMKDYDWEEVSRIYLEGINTGIATFENSLPTFDAWNKNHIKACRLLIRLDKKILGFTALSPTSSRLVYSGVAEVSIYIDEKYRGLGLGQALLTKLIELSEKNNFWTLHSSIMSDNIASIELHKRCGFRVIGIREKIGRRTDGSWHDNVLMERRSKIVGIY